MFLPGLACAGVCQLQLAVHGYSGGDSEPLSGVRANLQKLLALAHPSLHKRTLQQDFGSYVGLYQEERSPKAKTLNAALLQRWLLPFLSFKVLD